MEEKENDKRRRRGKKKKVIKVMKRGKRPIKQGERTEGKEQKNG